MKIELNIFVILKLEKKNDVCNECDIIIKI